MSNNPPTKQPKKKIDIANTLTNKGSWLVMIMVMLFSMRHVTETSLSLEPAGTWDIWGWLLGGAVDTGLIITALRLRTNKENVVLWIGFLSFLAMTGFANINNALPHAGEGWAWVASNEYWMLGKVVLFAGIIPLLIWMMAEVNIGDKPATESQPEPTTALATTTRHRQPATNNPPPKVKVRRRDNRIAATKAPAALPDNLPTMQRLQPTTTTTTYGQVDDFSDNHHHNYNPPPATEVEELQLVEVVEQVVSQDALNAVRWLQMGKSIAWVAKQQGVSSEGVRKRLRVAYLADPRDVTERIPRWVADNEKFLSEKK